MTPDRSATAYLSCAEPSWATAVSERQLRGILTLAALLSERVFLSDVHLGDNVNFLHSYLGASPLGLYRHLRSLTESGVVSVLLRTESVRPGTATPSFRCDSFADVYRSWRVQDPASAWIVPPDDEVRLRFMADIDGWASGSATRYDYAAVKRTFMDTVKALARADTFTRHTAGVFSAMPGSEADYHRLLARDWLSLSDFYRFFQSRGVPASHPVMLIHGLVNELAYSADVRASMVGADLYGEPLEDAFWPADPETEPDRPSGPVIESLLEHASSVLDVPALSVLGLLSADEIMGLRESHGRGYFEMLYLMNDPAYVKGSPHGAAALCRALASYWTAIADHLARRHPEATHTPRKLAIFLDMTPGVLRRASRESFSFALNVGVPAAAAAGAIPAPIAAASKTLAATASASLRFLFLAESIELRRIRSVIPDGTWLTKASPAIFPTADRMPPVA